MALVALVVAIVLCSGAQSAAALTSGALSGYLRDAAGNPVADAQIWVTGESGGGEAVTNEEGFYSIPAQAGSGYVLHARPETGFSDAELPMHWSFEVHGVDLSQPRTLNLTLPEVHRVGVEVIGPEKLPVNGARVLVPAVRGGAALGEGIETTDLIAETPTLTTNEAGLASFLAFSGGSEEYNGEAPVVLPPEGSGLHRAPFNVPVVAGDSTITVQLGSEAAEKRVEGKVFAAGEAAVPITGVRVLATSGITKEAVAVAETNFEGFYKLEVPEGFYDIAYTPPVGSEYRASTKEKIQVSSDLTMNVELERFAVATVSGVLRESAGRPVAGVRLQLSGETGSAEALTDQEGFYSISVPPGSGYRLHAAPEREGMDERLPDYWSFDVGGLTLTGSKTLDVTLPPADAVTVRVLGPEKAPVAGARVVIPRLLGAATLGEGLSTSDLASLSPQLVTGEQGTVSLLAFAGAAGEYDGEAPVVLPPEGDGYQRQPFSVPTVTGETTVTVQLERESKRLTGVLLDNDGDPVAGAHVTLSGGGVETIETTTGLDGSYSLAVPTSEGPYTLAASPQAGSMDADLPASWTLTVPSLTIATSRKLELKLPPVSQLSFQVLGLESQPVPDSLVDIGSLGGASALASEAVEARADSNGLQARTDEQGYVHFTVFDGGSATQNGETPVVVPAEGSGYERTLFDVPTITQNTLVILRFLGTGAEAVALTSSEDPSAHGATVTFTAKVSASKEGGPTPTGTVTFMEGSTALGSVELSHGSATYNTSALAVGSHQIVASYSGDANDPPAQSRTLTQLVSGASTQLTLSSTEESTAYGSAATLKAVVKALAPGRGTPTGTVTFSEGETTLATLSLGAGSATFHLAALAAGTHTITATYAPNSADFLAAEAQTVSEQVESAGTQLALSSSADPAAYGQAITLKAKAEPLAPGGGTPSGSVTFYNGEEALATITLVNGLATYHPPSLEVGEHAISAIYEPDTANYKTAPRAHLTQLVQSAPTQLALTSSADPTAYDSTATLKATVKAIAPGRGTPTGSVTFSEGEVALATVSLNNGVAVYHLAGLGPGTHPIVASYVGDSPDFAATEPSTIEQTIEAAATKLTLTSSANPAKSGSAAYLKATVKAIAPGGGTPTGSVTFSEGATTLATVALVEGLAKLAVGGLPAGEHRITGAYSGSADYATAEPASLVQTISP